MGAAGTGSTRGSSAPGGGPERVAPGPADLLAGLTLRHGRDRVHHVRTLPARTATTRPLPAWVPGDLREALARSGVREAWSHQVEAAEAARTGEHVVLATGTASGKSLGYLLPSLTAVLEGRGAASGRGASVLYLAPTKALAADQHERVERLGLPGVRAATYDGDTPFEERRWIRDHAQVVLTNPDMLHAAVLARHPAWSSFLRSLRYVVVDEAHAYRGVFGAHVAAVLRRLRRVAARYRADPTVVLASATMADPAGYAGTLVGAPVRAVTEDGSPRGALTLAWWQPAVRDDGTPRSAVAETGDLLAGLVDAGAQTLAFTRSRAGAETVASSARRTLDLGGGAVAAYRGGYLPEERRELERDLRSGRLRGLAATSALELGIDVSGLDAVVLAGWPGRLASFWQRVGRAGRDGRASLALLVADDDPLDRYLLQHPEAVLDRPLEAGVLDPGNPHVLLPQLASAAAELPLTEDDTRWFGPDLPRLAEELAARGVLRRRPHGWFWARPDHPADHVTLRGLGGAVQIVEERTGRVLGTIDEGRAHAQVHTGAVYVHQGRAHVVTDLRLPDGTAHVVRGDPGWSTQARSVSSFEILTEEEERPLGPARLVYGSVRITERVTGFLRRAPDGSVLGEHPLDLPERVLTTRGVWWCVDPDLPAAHGVGDADLPGALHAAEHAAIGVLPLLATCDRWDVGGVSTVLHPDTGLPTVMVHDGEPGGAGFAHRAFCTVDPWLRATLEVLTTCPCPDGCPACVQSPKCGNGNEPLHKAGARALLDALVGERVGTPGPPDQG